MSDEAEAVNPARWELPDFLEPYREMINNTGGNKVEDLLKAFHTDTRLMRTNIVVFTLAMATFAQVELLKTLYFKGLLRHPDSDATNRP